MPVFPLEKNFAEGEVFSLRAGDLRHLKKVLRVKIGEDFQVLLPNGQMALARLQKGVGDKFSALLTHYTEKKYLPALPLHIAIGLIRWSKLEWLVEKLTELGVSSLSLIITQYVKNSLKNKDNEIYLKIKKLEFISKETLKQCESTLALKIHPPVSLENFLNQNMLAKKENLKLRKWAFMERESTLPIFRQSSFQASELHADSHMAALLLIGPEGGFSAEEKKMIVEHRFTSFYLGDRVLRSETAAIYGASVFHAFRASFS